MRQEPDPSLLGGSDREAPCPFVMPPPGPVMRRDCAPVDLFDWVGGRHATDPTAQARAGVGATRTQPLQGSPPWDRLWTAQRPRETARSK